MWTTILVIALVLCLAVGPIMMVQPSKRDSRLARLRSFATSKGLRIRLSSEFDSQSAPVAIYSLPWPSSFIKKQREVINWGITKLNYSHEAHFANEWDWGEYQSAPLELRSSVSRGLKNVPAGVLYLGSNIGGIECAWSENINSGAEKESVMRVYNWLMSISDECSQAVSG